MTRKLRAMFHSRRYTDVLVFLSFLFFSAACWIFLALGDECQWDMEFPVQLHGVPENAVVTSDIPDSITVTVRDRGTEYMINYMWTKMNPIVFEWDDYENQGQHVRIRTQELQRKISAQLLNSTKIAQIKPDTIDYIYTYGKPKKVPVTIGGNIETSAQYYVVKTQIAPDSVTAYAPENMLSKLVAAQTRKVNKNDVKKNITFNVPLNAPKGVKFNPSNVRVKCFVDMFTEKTVDVPVIGEGFPPGCILRTFPSKVHITFQVGVSMYNKVHARDFKVVVRYGDLHVDGKDEHCIPHITVMPEYIRFAKITPGEIDYLVENRL